MLLFILVLKSNISTTELITNAGSGSKNVVTVQTKVDLANDFQKSFAGAIGTERSIQMTLIKTGNTINGHYQDAGLQNSLKLIGNIDTVGYCYFQEFDENHHITGIFEGQFIDNQLNGNWSYPDGSKILPFKINENKNISNPKIGKNLVVCSEEMVKNSNTTNPIIVKSCLFKDFKAVSIGRMDSKNRYYYVHDLFQNQNGKYTKITNTSFFNDNQNQLLSLINQAIQKKYIEVSTNPQISNCFKEKPMPSFQMDDMSITFDNINIHFNINFGLIGDCATWDEMSISFPIETIEPYLIQVTPK
jgi:hypothetical protein